MKAGVNMNMSDQLYEEIVKSKELGYLTKQGKDCFLILISFMNKKLYSPCSHVCINRVLSYTVNNWHRIDMTKVGDNPSTLFLYCAEVVKRAISIQISRSEKRIQIRKDKIKRIIEVWIVGKNMRSL